MIHSFETDFSNGYLFGEILCQFGVYNDIANAEGFVTECRQSKAFGFDGKTLIHPKQVEAANRLFGPGEQELARAERIICAWQEAEADGKAVVLVDNKLVEVLHVEEARRLLAIGQAIQAMDS